MEGLDFVSMLAHILAGGPEAIIALLLAIIAYLLYDRRNLTKSIAELSGFANVAKEEEKRVILSIVDRYHGGNLAMVQAMNEIKIVLASLQERIR